LTDPPVSKSLIHVKYFLRLLLVELNRSGGDVRVAVRVLSQQNRMMGALSALNAVCVVGKL